MIKTTTQEPQMTTYEKSAKIASYYVHHTSNGLSAEKAIDHIASGLDVERGTVIVAIHYFMTHDK